MRVSSKSLNQLALRSHFSVICENLQIVVYFSMWILVDLADSCQIEAVRFTVENKPIPLFPAGK